MAPLSAALLEGGSMMREGQMPKARLATISLAAFVAALIAMPHAEGGAPADDEARVAKAFEDLRSYDHGKLRAPLTLLEAYVARSTRDPAAARRAAERLAAVLADPAAAPAAKDFACSQLLIVGGEGEVPALEAMLADPATAETARRTLEGIPGEASLAALRGALAKLEGAALAGAVNSLGIRRDAKAVGPIGRLLGSADEEVAGAAVAALGGIASPEAARALGEARVPESLEPAVRDARLACARALAASGDGDAAAAIYRAIWTSDGTPAWRIAGLAGLAEVAGGGALGALLEGMGSAQPEIQAAALRLVRELPGREATSALVRELPKLDAKRQALVMDVLAERGDRSAAGAVAGMTDAKDAGVRAAALAALGALGDASHVETLARRAAAGNPAARLAARKALARLSAPGVDAKVLALAEKGDPAARAEAMGAIEARGTAGAAAVLLAAAGDGDARVRRAALGALAATADAASYPRLVTILAGARGPADARAAEKAVVATGARLGRDERALGPVLEALRRAPARAKPSFLRVLGHWGGAEALAAVRAALADTDAAVRDEAVRALSKWPDASAAGDLVRLARESEDARHRTLALRGYLGMAREAAREGRTDAALGMIESARPLAAGAPEKRLLLSCLGQTDSPEALRRAVAYLGDPEVGGEAAAAVLALGAELVRRDRDAVRAAADTLLAKVKDAAVVAEAEALRAESMRPPGPTTAEQALAQDPKRTRALRRRLVSRAPDGFRLACYVDCGPDRSDGGGGRPELRLVTGQPWFWAGSDAAEDVRFGTVAFDGTEVRFEAAGLDPEREYRVGFSWWDYDHGTRIGSVWASPSGPGRRARLLDATNLPSATRKERPGGRELAVPREVSAGGGFRIAFRNEGGPNAVVSEIWLWESEAKSPAPVVRDPRAGRKPTTRVVIITGVEHPAHDWRTTAPALREGLEEDPRLGVDVVEDPGFLASPKLAEYDVVILHFMDHQVPAPGAEARANLLGLVAGGKGLALVHFACGAFQDWPEFRDLVGRVWDPKLRGHDPRGRFRVEVAAPAHPIMKGLGAFEADDELYTCTVGEKPFDVLATARSKVDGKEYPMAFVLEFGKGRVFHCLLGHDVRALEAGSVLELYRRGVAWAAGIAPVPPK